MVGIRSIARNMPRKKWQTDMHTNVIRRGEGGDERERERETRCAC